jgi:hypothetical protein
MSSFYWPSQGQGGVTVYSNFAAFPSVASVGSLGIDATTGILYEYFSGAWKVLATLGFAGKYFQEAPSGTPNGILVTFTLSNTPVSNASVKIYLDGTIQYQGSDYTISGATITFAVAPAANQSLWSDYVY